MTYKQSHFFTLILAGAAAFLSPHFAQGALVIADFNDLSAGILDDQSGGTGFSGNWDGATTIDVIGGDLSSSNYNISQSGTPHRVRSVGLAQDEVWNQSRGLAATMTGEIWFSFLVNNPTNTNSGITFNESDDTGTPSDGLIFAGTTLRVYQDGGITQVANALTAGTTSLVVGQMIIDGPSDTLNIWIDPDLFADPDINNYSPAFSDSATSFISSLSRIGLISYASPNTNPGGEIDSIRFSDTETAFFDVTGIGGVLASPEPSTFCLAIVAFFAIGRMRHSRPRR